MLDENSEKSKIFDVLNENFVNNQNIGSLVIENLLQAPKSLFEILFMLCDNINSPVKQKSIIITIDIDKDIAVDPRTSISEVRDLFRRKLSPLMESFYTEPLLSRMLVLALVLN